MFRVGVYWHVWRPFCVYAWIVWVFHYFIDKFGYVHRKSDALDTFIEFKVDQITYWVSILGTLIGSKWCMSSKFDSFHREYKIISQLCAPGTTIQNGEVERRYQILIDIVRLVIRFFFLLIPIFFWRILEIV